MNWRRNLGVTFVVAGSALLATFVVPSVYGSAMSHLAVSRFRAESASNRMWDSSRIRAYQQSLNRQFAPAEAVLRVPRLGIEVPVLEGTSDLVLNRGVGHIPGTALPGQPGNVALTGHRDGFFRPLKDIAPGDVLEVQRSAAALATGSTMAMQTDRYIVRHIRIVSPSDLSVLEATGGSTLTLVTCYPFYFIGAAPQRFIVQASLLPEASFPGMQDPSNSVQSTPGD